MLIHLSVDDRPSTVFYDRFVNILLSIGKC